MEDANVTDTPISTATKLGPERTCTPVEIKLYMGMIGSVIYLTTSQPDIVFKMGL